MITKGTMKTVAYMIADSLFEKRCRILDKYILDCFDKACEGEKISKERKERIKKKFYDNMLDESKKLN